MTEYDTITPPDLFTPGQYGLSSVVNWVPGQGHWQAGIKYDTDCTEVAITMMECISGATISGKVDTWGRQIRGARPFTLYDRASCSPAGGEWWTVGQTKALRALANSGPIGLERAFWNGQGNAGPALVYPNLTSIGPVYDSTGYVLLQPSATIVSGALPMDIVEGLGVLEAALGLCYDGEGVIHVPFRLGAALAANYLIYKDGNVLRTFAGNKVVLGRGYASDVGRGFTTPPVGSTWMYATSPIFGMRGTPHTFDPVQMFNRSVNTYQVLAEQTFLLGWSCCLAGVLVTTGGLTGGAPSTALQAT